MPKGCEKWLSAFSSALAGESAAIHGKRAVLFVVSLPSSIRTATRSLQSAVLWPDKPRETAATQVNHLNNNPFPRKKSLPPNCFFQLCQGFDNGGTAFQERISSSIPSYALSLLRSSRFLPHDSGCNRLPPQNTASGRAGIRQRRGSHPRNYPGQCRNRHPR